MSGASSETRNGLFYALGAHAFWGVMPLYLLLLKSVPPLEFVAWRLIFTLPLCFLFIALTRGWGEFRAVFRSPKALLTLVGSASMVAVNWFLYVWSIQNGHVYADPPHLSTPWCPAGTW